MSRVSWFQKHAIAEFDTLNEETQVEIMTYIRKNYVKLAQEHPELEDTLKKLPFVKVNNKERKCASQVYNPNNLIFQFLQVNIVSFYGNLSVSGV